MYVCIVMFVLHFVHSTPYNLLTRKFTSVTHQDLLVSSFACVTRFLCNVVFALSCDIHMYTLSYCYVWNENFLFSFLCTCAREKVSFCQNTWLDPSKSLGRRMLNSSIHLEFIHIQKKKSNLSTVIYVSSKVTCYIIIYSWETERQADWDVSMMRKIVSCLFYIKRGVPLLHNLI